MAFKKQSLSELQVSMTAQLIEIQEITKLCGFAAEARRILADIEVTSEVNDELRSELDDTIAARHEWIEHDDSLGPVLKIVGKKIQAVIDQIEEIAS